MAQTKVSINESAIPTISVDANGWTVYNWGTFKQYRFSGNTTQSLTGNQWKFTGTVKTLPTGITDTTGYFVDMANTVSDSAVTIAGWCNNSGVQFAITSQYGGAINNFIIYYSVCLTSPS